MPLDTNILRDYIAGMNVGHTLLPTVTADIVRDIHGHTAGDVDWYSDKSRQACVRYLEWYMEKYFNGTVTVIRSAVELSGGNDLEAIVFDTNLDDHDGWTEEGPIDPTKVEWFLTENLFKAIFWMRQRIEDIEVGEGAYHSHLAACRYSRGGTDVHCIQ